MKKMIALCLVACLALSMGAVQVLGADAYDHFSGSGTQADPFLIQSEQDFYNLIDATNDNTDMAKYYIGADGTPKYFSVTRDLDMAEYSVNGYGIGITGNGWNLLDISSVFDGGTHVIKNLSITNDAMMVGLFGQLNGGTVKNLTLDHATLTSTSTSGNRVGFLAADCRNSATITNCSVTHSTLSIPAADGMRVGGLVANNNGLGISYCSTYNNTYPDFSEKSVSFGSVFGSDVGKAIYCYSDLQPIASTLTTSVAYNAIVNYNVGKHGKLMEQKKGFDTAREVGAAAVTEAVAHTYTVIPEDGYTYLVKVNGTTVQTDENHQFVYQPSGITDIKVEFVLESGESLVTNNQISVGEGGKVTIDGKDYTGTGTLEDLIANNPLDFVITPDEGKAVDTITYHGEALPADTTSVTVVKDAVLSVTFKKDPAWETTENDPYGNFSGKGTLGEPFVIQSEQDFYNLIDATNDNTDMAKYYTGADGTPKYFKITSDLDMKDYPVKGNGIGVAADWNMLKITSHFDGGEHVVKNLSITTAVNMTGLFGKLEGGSVQNLTLDHFVMTSSSTAGVYAGLLASDTRAGGSIRNCSVINSVLSIPGADGMRVGGLVANNNGMLIAGCTCYDNTYPDFGKKNVTFGSVLGGDAGKAVNCSSDLQPIVGGATVGQYAAVVNFDVGVCGSLLEGGEEVPATALVELVKHTYKIVPDAGYTYYLTVNGTETQADGDLQFTYQPSDAAVIKVVFVPEGLDSIRAHNSVSVGQGGKVTINDTEYTENGELDDLIINDRLTFTVTPQEGKAIDELSYNGVVLDSDTTSVTVAKDAVLKVTFQDIIAADSALYVAPDGSDDNNGSIDAPFASLEKARDTIRQYRKEGRIPQGGMTVYLREGVYYPTQTFTLSEEDSGTAEKPITYAAYPEKRYPFPVAGSWTIPCSGR